VKLDSLEYRIRSLDTSQLSQSNLQSSQVCGANNKLSIAIDGQEGKTEIQQINMIGQELLNCPLVESKLEEIDMKVISLKSNMKNVETIDNGSDRLRREMEQLKTQFSRLDNLEKKTKK